MNTTAKAPSVESLPQHLAYLKLPFMQEQHAALAQQAAQAHWDHVAYLVCLAQGEAAQARERSVQRRITQARFINGATMARYFLIFFQLIFELYLVRIKIVTSGLTISKAFFHIKNKTPPTKGGRGCKYLLGTLI